MNKKERRLPLYYIHERYHVKSERHWDYTVTNGGWEGKIKLMQRGNWTSDNWTKKTKDSCWKLETKCCVIPIIIPSGSKDNFPVQKVFSISAETLISRAASSEVNVEILHEPWHFPKSVWFRWTPMTPAVLTLVRDVGNYSIVFSPTQAAFSKRKVSRFAFLTGSSLFISVSEKGNLW